MGKAGKPRGRVVPDHSGWTPFQPAGAVVGATAKYYDVRKDGVAFFNNVYNVMVLPVPSRVLDWPDMFRLSISRKDRSHINDWRELQRVKNEIIGPEHEAMQLFPAESRLVDTANQIYLFVVARPGVAFPIGFFERLVMEGTAGGAVQRDFPRGQRPPDAIDAAAIDLDTFIAERMERIGRTPKELRAEGQSLTASGSGA